MSCKILQGCTRVISPFASENIIIQGRFFKEETWSQPFFHIFIYLSQENLGNCPVKKIRVRKSATSVLLFKKILFHSLYFQQVKYVPVTSDIFTNIFSAVRDFIVYSTDLTPFLSNSVCSVVKSNYINTQMNTVQDRPKWTVYYSANQLRITLGSI